MKKVYSLRICRMNPVQSYRDYIQEVANVMRIMGLLSCFHDTNNGEYPRYNVEVTEALAASYYFAFRKDW